MATYNDIEIKPNHVIVWLDENMGQHRNNRPSKTDLANNANLDSLPSDERSLDIDNLINSFDEDMNNENLNDLIKNPLRVFVDTAECIKCINDNIQANKQPFLITSGRMGKTIVPMIYKKLRGFIYIFCGDIAKHLDQWAHDYTDYIETHDFETELFVRLLRDISRYYIEKSEEASSNLTSSQEYLQWARCLAIRANKMQGESKQVLLTEIDNKLTVLESSNLNGENDDDQIGKDADEG